MFLPIKVILDRRPRRDGSSPICLLNQQLQKMVRSAEDLVTFALEEKMDDPVGFLKKAWRPDLDAISLAI